MKHVYIFGAGASTASGNAPLGKDLVWNYHVDCRNFVSIENGVPDLLEENKEFSSFRRFIELASSIYPELNSLPQEWDNRGIYMFDLYRRIAKEHYVDEILMILHQKKDSQGIELVRKLIFEHLVEASVGSQNLLYNKFIERILKKLSSQQVAIISFNFDFLLREDFRKDVYFDYLLKFDWIDPNRKRIYARNYPVRLIKPNGSLDWGICPSCNRLHLYFPNMSRHFYDDKQCSEKCEHSIQPFIIIPHETYRSIIGPLWSLAENELMQAIKVTIIGYSFPEYDEKVLDLFRRSLHANTKLVIVDRCEPKEDKDRKKNAILMKYRHLFPMIKTEIEVNLSGFEGYLNSFTS